MKGILLRNSKVSIQYPKLTQLLTFVSQSWPVLHRSAVTHTLRQYRLSWGPITVHIHNTVGPITAAWLFLVMGLLDHDRSGTFGLVGKACFLKRGSGEREGQSF